MQVKTKPINIIRQPQESDIAALAIVFANPAPQNWAAISAETVYALFSAVNSFACEGSWRLVAYIPMRVFEHAEHEGVLVFGSGIPRGKE